MKFLWMILFAITFGFGAFSQDGRDSTIRLIDSIARSQLGVDYKYATCNPDNSFDCSGFASYVYTSVGVESSRSSSAYGNLGEKVSLADAAPGDCILFSGTKGSRSQIGHVGIVLHHDSTGLYFIHCSSSKKHPGVILTEYYSSNYPDRFIMVRRLF